MKYEPLRLRLRGVVPLVMHNGQLANPLNDFAKEMKKVSSKRKKTDADYEQLAKLEWFGGLYLHDGKPCLPGELIEAALVEGAKKSKRGQQAKAGLISDGFWPLEYMGSKSPDEMWLDPQFRLTAGVRVQRARVMRTRPIFPKWEATVQVDYLPGQLDASDVKDILTTAGQIVGLGDWRPKFGRFELVP